MKCLVGAKYETRRVVAANVVSWVTEGVLNSMGKKKKRRHRRRSSDTAAEMDSALLAAYLSDPIALLQDGDYEALDALYANEDAFGAEDAETPLAPEEDTSIADDDLLPF